MWLEWAKILAPITAAIVAGGVALYVSNRNVRTISANADKTIESAETNTDRSIAAAAANVAAARPAGVYRFVLVLQGVNGADLRIAAA